MDAKIKEWDASVADAKADVLKALELFENPHLRETSDHMQSEFDEFYEVVGTILNCDQNPYGFLDSGNWLSTWESTSGFISSFRHSCIDDGDHCYLSDPLHGPKLVFRWMHDYDQQELYYMVHPHAKDMDERISDLHTRVGKGKSRAAREFEFHTDYERFIKELKGRPEFERKRNEEFAARMVKFKECVNVKHQTE
ncbi:hypothetical protein HYP58_gp49 [Vibrio phage 1.097.O._10N.286.49.B3]|uniref:Uncharacterized protein n=1 Tax=Vibrio phage 1.097.O._10N.286.49.B3 TaxID=1881383 RepID=A0A2I7R0P6_9CAUD|nr:hypothetical protein HYP58_gp49 [Vibrio phage 1.097.O._10N.286.49.B3]AUR87195.1 hypothetical protein NVP1097O_49 [Vibrio phage 1.097.O._10N.286.49.B3]